ncbi:hypothetical protein [Streptomyces sp. NPDC058964]|uniref:hypothetical protein n=1 Tax=Streptomyces sp. NPDC058964 TaxID=3346681 RepID=UPI0036983730
MIRTTPPRPLDIEAVDDNGPVALVPLAQLFARDVPGLMAPEGRDLVQVLWCPYDAHGSPPGPGVRLV